MLKTTWPQYLPGDKAVERLAANAFDICEYVVALERTDGLAEGLAPLDGRQSRCTSPATPAPRESARRRR